VKPLSEQDLALVALVRAGDPKAMEALYRAYYRRLRATTIHFLGPQDSDGEDIVQETFSVAMQKLPGVVIQTNLYGWLNRVCALLCFERLRDRKRLLAVEQEGLLEALGAKGKVQAGALDAMVDDEQGLQLRRAIAGLGHPCSEILTLRDLEGMSYVEVARRMKTPIGTVMSRLLRCRQALKARLKSQGLGG
jgi:RNA polymerase sigma-70 factor (ECF subfamily)